MYSIYKATIETTKKIQVNFIRVLGFSYISRGENKNLGSLFLKSLLHYLQIVALIGLNKLTLGFDIPIGISFFPNSIG